MTRLHTLVIGTRNRKKLAEIERLLDGLPVALKTIDAFPHAKEVEEKGRTFQENAILKATEFATQIGEWVVADDSGLEVDALEGKPGVFSARYAGPDQNDLRNTAKVLEELRALERECAAKGMPVRPRTARFKCAIALASPEGLLFVVEDSCEGHVSYEPRGSAGFGYDPIFIPNGYDQTFAELGNVIKDGLSHRGKALRRFRLELEKRL